MHNNIAVSILHSTNYQNYFLILRQTEIIYLFITQTPEGETTVFVVVESRSILYSSKIVCLLVDWFTGYNGIMTEHLRNGALWNIGVHLKLWFSVNCQTTIAFRAILSLHFHQLWVCHTVHHIVPLTCGSTTFRISLSGGSATFLS